MNPPRRWSRCAHLCVLPLRDIAETMGETKHTHTLAHARTHTRIHMHAHLTGPLGIGNPQIACLSPAFPLLHPGPHGAPFRTPGVTAPDHEGGSWGPHWDSMSFSLYWVTFGTGVARLRVASPVWALLPPFRILLELKWSVSTTLKLLPPVKLPCFIL